ncbi:MAG: elongation factor-1 alpha [Thiogranum sp.]|nr:elongation factor-1 alpha [Thiogranum sp.]
MMVSRRFYDCPLSETLLYTAFLLLMSIGYLMALVYLYTSHEGHDGKPGLSIEDIVDTYYGNRSGTRLEAAVRGPMAGYVQQDEDRYEIIAWLKSGAPEAGYRATVRPIVERSCLQCHSPASGLKIPDLSTYAGIKTVADVDTGESLHTLMKLSHIHLFGIGLVALGIGLIFRLAALPPWLKATLMVVPFAAIFADILAWFLTKWDPFYAYTVVIAGVLLGLAWAVQIAISLYQLWFMRTPEGNAHY